MRMTFMVLFLSGCITGTPVTKTGTAISKAVVVPPQKVLNLTLKFPTGISRERNWWIESSNDLISWRWRSALTNSIVTLNETNPYCFYRLNSLPWH